MVGVIASCMASFEYRLNLCVCYALARALVACPCGGETCKSVMIRGI